MKLVLGSCLVFAVAFCGCSLTTHFDQYHFGTKDAGKGGSGKKDAGAGDGAASGGSGTGGSGSKGSDGGKAGDAGQTGDGGSAGDSGGATDSGPGADAGPPADCVHGLAEGDACGPDDSTTDPATSCSRDFVCKSGKCKAQTVESCSPALCQVSNGCEAGKGCSYKPAPRTTSCDDGSMCTSNDHCAGTTADCVGTVKDCSDGVGCTVDSCDPGTGTCSNRVDDSQCSKACQTGTCDATMDCQYTNLTDFTACDDGSSTTTPDFCYMGACTGGNRTDPGASCAVGSCGCSSFGAAKDLEYYASLYLALWSTNQTGAGCTTGEVSLVYEVSPTSFQAYTSSGSAGGVAQTAYALMLDYAITDSTVGVINTGSRDVVWSGNYISAKLASSTPALVHYRGGAFHHEGGILGGTDEFWLYGADSTTSTTARLVRCTWSQCTIAPCTDPVPSCAYDTTFGTASILGLTPYLKNTASGVGLPNYAYQGVGTLVNLSSGTTTREIFDDGTNKDYVPSELVLSYVEGSWHGLLKLSGSASLAYGIGNTSLVYCDDTDFNGSMTCTAISGLPNQTSRSYYDATLLPSGGVAMIATSCTGLCTGATYYLVVLPGGADPKVGSNWQEFAIGTFNGLVGSVNTIPQQVAAGGTSIVVVGLHGGIPYAQTFGTF